MFLEGGYIKTPSYLLSPGKYRFRFEAGNTSPGLNLHKSFKFEDLRLSLNLRREDSGTKEKVRAIIFSDGKVIVQKDYLIGEKLVGIEVPFSLSKEHVVFVQIEHLKEGNKASPSFPVILKRLMIKSVLTGKPSGKVVGKGVGKAMPDFVRMHSKSQYEAEIRVLAATGISPYPEQWLKTL